MSKRCPRCGCAVLWPDGPCVNVACDPVWGLVTEDERPPLLDDQGEDE